MSHASDHGAVPEAPGRLALPGSVRILSILVVVAGIAAFAWALSGGHSELAWSSYLIGAFYSLGLGAFGVAWIAILYLSRGVWSVSMRRPIAILFLPWIKST